MNAFGPSLSPSSLRAAIAALACTSALCAPAPGFAAEPVMIGFTGPLSGLLALPGQGVRDGVQVCVSDINEQDKVLALVTPTGTPNVTAMLGDSEECKLPIIGPCAFSNKLTTPTKRYAFATLPEVRLQTGMLAEYS